MRTVAAFSGEQVEYDRYVNREVWSLPDRLLALCWHSYAASLQKARDQGVKQGIAVSCCECAQLPDLSWRWRWRMQQSYGMGTMFICMFGSYALALWFGAKLIRNGYTNSYTVSCFRSLACVTLTHTLLSCRVKCGLLVTSFPCSCRA